MYYMNDDDMMVVNGGEITLDINKLVDQINPLKWFYDFGHDVVYPYIYNPVRNFVNGLIK